MGVVVDTGVIIAHERRGNSAGVLRSALSSLLPSEVVWLSAMTLAELVQGIYQARTPEQQQVRSNFVREVDASFGIIPFTRETAWLAGQVRGEQARLGNSLPVADSLIAAAALELNCSVLTMNIDDFARIPGLRTIPFRIG